jgi:serine/threonine protein kinase
MRKILRKLKPKKTTYEDLEQKVSGEVVFIDGVPIKEITFLGMSRMGNLSWKGKLEGVPVKIYEAFNPDHARTVADIMQLADLQELFPTLYLRKEKYLVVEWVDGILLESVMTKDSIEYIQQIFWLQHRIHHCYQKILQPDFFHYFAYLFSRYKKYVGPFDHSHTQFLMSISDTGSLQLPGANRFFHLDITPTNIVLQKGKLKVIDNELLGFGIYYPFDYFNTYHAIKLHPGADEYLRLIRDHEMDHLRWILDYKESFLTMWNLRMVGSSIQSGHRFSAMLRSSEQPLSHPIFEFLEK